MSVRQTTIVTKRVKTSVPTHPIFSNDYNMYTSEIKRKSNSNELSKSVKLTIGASVALFVLIIVAVVMYFFICKKKHVTISPKQSACEHSKIKRKSSRARESGSQSKRSRSSGRFSYTAEKVSNSNSNNNNNNNNFTKLNTIEPLLTPQGKSIAIRSHYTSKGHSDFSHKD